MDHAEIRTALDRAGLSVVTAAALIGRPVRTLRAYMRPPDDPSARRAPPELRQEMAAMLRRHAAGLEALAREMEGSQ